MRKPPSTRHQKKFVRTRDRRSQSDVTDIPYVLELNLVYPFLGRAPKPHADYAKSPSQADPIAGDRQLLMREFAKPNTESTC